MHNNVRLSTFEKDHLNLCQVFIFEPPHNKTNKMTAPSEDSDQPWHPHSLIRVFAVRSMDSEGPKLSSSGQRRFLSDWADAQADLSLRWAHMPFCWFCHEAAHFMCVGGFRPLLYLNCLLQIEQVSSEDDD